MPGWVTCLLMSLAAATAWSGVAAWADESKPTEAPDKAAATAAQEAPVDLPPGFKAKKRGKYIVYCRSEAPLGSRIKQESCFDEAQMRDYLIALQETKGNVDKIRSTCSNVCACGMPDAC